MNFTGLESEYISYLAEWAAEKDTERCDVSIEMVRSLHGVFERIESERSPLTAKEVEALDVILSNATCGDVSCSQETVDIARLALVRLGLMEPPEKSDAQVIYEAEGLYEKPWCQMTGGERAQYERMARALRARIASEP